MKTPQEMAQAYGNSASYAAAAWNEAKPRIVSNWVESMTQLLGRPPKQARVAKMQARLANAQYKTGDPQKYINNYLAKM